MNPSIYLSSFNAWTPKKRQKPREKGIPLDVSKKDVPKGLVLSRDCVDCAFMGQSLLQRQWRQWSANLFLFKGVRKDLQSVHRR